MDLTDKQWEIVKREIPKHKVRKDHKGRPWQNDRAVLNGILWILRTGAPWKDLPERYPSRATCHRRFQEWSRDGTFKKIWRQLIHLLDDQGRLDWSEAFIDGSFASAKKGGLALVLPRGEKAQNGWPSLMVVDFLSQSRFIRPRPTKRSLQKPPSSPSPSRKGQKNLLATKPTQASH